MPTYEYTCKNCQHYLEANQSLHEAALVNCPSCHGASLEQMISMTRFHLKGKGWYRDETSHPSTADKTDTSSNSTTAS